MYLELSSTAVSTGAAAAGAIAAGATGASGATGFSLLALVNCSRNPCSAMLLSNESRLLNSYLRCQF